MSRTVFIIKSFPDPGAAHNKTNKFGNIDGMTGLLLNQTRRDNAADNSDNPPQVLNKSGPCMSETYLQNVSSKLFSILGGILADTVCPFMG